VFHRFLAGERPFRRVSIRISGRDLDPFDPFHSKHPATSQLREETVLVEGFLVTAQPYVLPHHKKVSARDWDRYAGEAGYLKQIELFHVFQCAIGVSMPTSPKP
jgi:hypothetical protein